MDQPNTYSVGTYAIYMKVKDVDLTKFVHSFRITNTTNSIYPIVTFELNMNNTDLILQELFGQTKIECAIVLLGENEAPKRVSKLNLFEINSNLNLTPKTGNDAQNESKRQVTSFVCMVVDCFTLMCKGLNACWEEPASKTPLDILEQTFIASGVPQDNMSFDKRGSNTDLISQVLLPAMTVNQTISYVNEKYGLYQGPWFKFCHYDLINEKAILVLKDLNQAMNDNPLLTFYQLPSDVDQQKSDEIFKACSDEYHFYTKFPIQTINFPNSNIINFRYSKTQIIHPEDNLYALHVTTMDDIAKEFPSSTNNKLQFFDFLKGIESRQCTGLKGFGYNKNAFTSRLASQIQNTFSIGIQVHHKLCIDYLIGIGCTCQFIPASIDYLSYAGNYILKSSDVTFTRMGEQWETSCDVVLTRTTRSGVST